MIDTAVALVVTHDSTVVLPDITLVLDAVNVTVGAGATTVTVTVLVAGVVPAAPVAVMVYVVVVVGDTVTLPDATLLCEPIPLLIDTVVALVVTHDNTALLPLVILLGVATKLDTTGSLVTGMFTVTVTCAVLVPPEFLAVIVYVVVVVGDTVTLPSVSSMTLPTP